MYFSVPSSSSLAMILPAAVHALALTGMARKHTNQGRLLATTRRELGPPCQLH